MDYRTLNPATEEEVRRYALHAPAEVERIIVEACSAFGAWRSRPIRERSALLEAVAQELERRRDELAALMALEMGKPLAQARAEVAKCARGCRYFAEQGGGFLRPDPRPSDGRQAFVSYEPLGPLLAIMPWNYPLWQFYRFAAPALMAGNVVVLKHAPNTPQCALAIERVMLEAGLPRGVVQNVFLSNAQAAGVIADRRVRGVTLTGSTRAGSQVAREAGSRLKPMVMELGGSDPFIVLDDADLSRAIDVGVDARCQNSGQSCIAAKRFLVHRSRWKEFRDGFVAGMQARVVGSPEEPDVDVGPLARADLRQRLDDQVRSSVAAGAHVLCGGSPPRRLGYFYPPTVLVDVPAGTPAADEELFGPVATLTAFGDDAEAVALANATTYGLGASLWTSDPERARGLVGRIEAGSVFVNGLVKSDPRLPFGGIKESGFGRELGREGLLAFVNTKTVWLA